MNIGILSDTHGALTKEAFAALREADYIIHAGDIGNLDVITALATIAPVSAVRGNTDGAWARKFPHDDFVQIAQRCFYVLHDVQQIDLDPRTAGIDVVVSGHTHRAEYRYSDGVLFFNPGSASVSRYGGPLTIGFIKIHPEHLEPRLIQIDT